MVEKMARLSRIMTSLKVRVAYSIRSGKHMSIWSFTGTASVTTGLIYMAMMEGVFHDVCENEIDLANEPYLCLHLTG